MITSRRYRKFDMTRALCSLIAFGGVALMSSVSASAATRTITGQIVYGPVRDDIGEFSDPDNFINQGSPIPFVTVQLNGGFGKEGDDVTDANGRFSIVITGTPSLTLVTKAKNEHVEVRQDNTPLNLPTDDVIKTKRDIVVDYGTCTAGSTCDVGIVTVTDDNTDTFLTLFATKTNYASRAFYAASVGQWSYDRIEQLYSGDFPNGAVNVRMGLGGFGGTAYTLALSDTIFLNTDDATTLWHEYGHFIEDKIGSLGLVPSYFQHQTCTMMTETLSSAPNVCWSWFEGLAEWFAVVNAADAYGGDSGQQAVLCRVPAGSSTCSPELSIETNTCGTTWTEPKAVESVVSNVLWDLVDSVQDVPNTTGIDEIANLTEQDVVAVMSLSVPGHNPCKGLDSYTHPVGLDDFWTNFRALHPGLVPDLYAAYAHNGVATGVAADTAAPGPITLVNTSHSTTAWSNDPSVDLTTTRGTDDVSGSYIYYASHDTFSQTDADLTGPEAFRDKDDVNQFSVSLGDGEWQYIHVNTKDMAGHAGTASAHVGPFRIDTVDPYFVGGFQPPAEKVLVIGYNTQISWSSADDLSGVSYVTLEFEDRFSGFKTYIAQYRPATGTYTWYVDNVPATLGFIVITATDRAGNNGVHKIPVRVVTPFTGLQSRPDLDDARVISANLDNLGSDEIVVDKQNGAGSDLQVLTSSTVAFQTFAWNAVDDLYAADYDRDGDLDVLTASRTMVGGTMLVEFLNNNGAGTLANPGVTIALGDVRNKKLRVAPVYDDGRPVIMVFGTNPAGVAVTRFHRCLPGFPSITIAGLTPVAGDWETGDIDGDGDIDLVALGRDSANAAGLYIFRNAAGIFSRETVESYVTIADPNVDLGDSNADGQQDIFVMLDDGSNTRITKRLVRSGAAWITSGSATDAAQQIARGDGYIVDLEADASAEVVAMGQTELNANGSWYLRNNSTVGLAMERIPPGMVALQSTDSAWGDFDADGDLDIYQKGFDSGDLYLAEYFNQIGDYIKKNTPPPAPVNLSSTYDAARGGYVFTWASPGLNNDQTPEVGFSYELRVGTTNGGSEILSWVHQAGPGLHGSGESRFVKMAKGVYYATVRAVDSGWMRSAASATHRTKP